MAKKRRGSLLVVVAFAMMIFVVSFGTLSVASTFYVSNSESANNYANLESYRAATELCIYQYCNDLQAAVVTRDLSSGWLSVTGSAIYSQALVTIIQSLSADTIETPLKWKMTDVGIVIGTAAVSDGTALVNLLALIQAGRNELSVELDDYPDIDYSSEESYIAENEALFKLDTIPVNITLVCKGETLNETFYLDNLYLDVLTETGESGTLVTMTINSGEEGVDIYRE